MSEGICITDHEIDLVCSEITISADQKVPDILFTQTLARVASLPNICVNISSVDVVVSLYYVVKFMLCTPIPSDRATLGESSQ